ncbi:MAG: hypothetical protein ACOVSW_22865 [Candidatus Kapaibacteriota bacterium]
MNEQNITFSDIEAAQYAAEKSGFGVLVDMTLSNFGLCENMKVSIGKRSGRYESADFSIIDKPMRKDQVPVFIAAYTQFPC